MASSQDAVNQQLTAEQLAARQAAEQAAAAAGQARSSSSSSSSSAAVVPGEAGAPQSESAAAGRGVGAASRFPISMKFYYDRLKELRRLSKAEIQKIQAEADAENPTKQSEIAQKQWEIAQCFHYGFQVPINDNKANRYLDLAAKNHHPEALCNIGRKLCDGHRGLDLPSPEDPKVKSVAFQYAKEALGLGYEGALYVLANCYLKNYIPPEEEQSTRLLMAYHYIREDFEYVYEHLAFNNKENRMGLLEKMIEALRARSAFADAHSAQHGHFADECEKIKKKKEPAFLRQKIQQLKQEQQKLKEQAARRVAARAQSSSSSSSSSSASSSSAAAFGAAAGAAVSVPMSDSVEMPQLERDGLAFMDLAESELLGAGPGRDHEENEDNPQGPALSGEGEAKSSAEAAIRIKPEPRGDGSDAAAGDGGPVSRFSLSRKFYTDRMAELGKISEEEIQKIKDHADATGDAQSQWEVAVCFGNLSKENQELKNTFYQYLSLAAKQKHPYAMVDLAIYLCSAENILGYPLAGSPERKELAFQYANQALALGYEGASYGMYACYLQNHIPESEKPNSNRLSKLYQFMMKEITLCFNQLDPALKLKRIIQLQQLKAALFAESTAINSPLSDAQREEYKRLGTHCYQVERTKNYPLLQRHTAEQKQELQKYQQAVIQLQQEKDQWQLATQKWQKAYESKNDRVEKLESRLKELQGMLAVRDAAELQQRQNTRKMVSLCTDPSLFSNALAPDSALNVAIAAMPTPLSSISSSSSSASSSASSFSSPAPLPQQRNPAIRGSLPSASSGSSSSSLSSASSNSAQALFLPSLLPQSPAPIAQNLVPGVLPLSNASSAQESSSSSSSSAQRSSRIARSAGQNKRKASDQLAGANSANDVTSMTARLAKEQGGPVDQAVVQEIMRQGGADLLLEDNPPAVPGVAATDSSNKPAKRRNAGKRK